MRICLMIEGQEDVGWDDWLALADACERTEIEGLFRSDHYASVFGIEGRSSLDAWATINALAATTARIRLGTMVSPATFRHPSQLAKLACTADHVSGGRIELGLGSGWNETEHRAYGFPFHDMTTRLAIFAEQLEIIHGQWSQDPYSFSGTHYTLENCRSLPRPVQQPRPPLIVGGGATPATVGPAARFADEYNTVYASPEQFRERRDRVEAACAAIGRDPATMVVSLMTALIVGSDRAELLERARRVMARVQQEGDPAEFLVQKAGEGWIVGTTDEVAARMRAYAAAGVDRFFMQHLDHRDIDTVELLGTKVARAVG